MKGRAALEHLKDVLRENSIYCSSPMGFNDPWDGKPYFDSSSVDDPDQRELWKTFFAEQCMYLTSEAYENIRRGVPDGLNDKMRLRCSVENMTKEVAKNNGENYRVVCLTTSPTSLLMWAHYASKHEGFCLEFDMTKEKLWRARRVEYSDRLPVVKPEVLRDPERLLELSLLTKSKEWAYEEEYRILGRDSKIDSTTFSLATQDDFLKLPEGAITGVIAGERADINALRAIMQEHAPGIPLKRAKVRPNEYHLEIVDDE